MVMSLVRKIIKNQREGRKRYGKEEPGEQVYN